MGDSLTTSLERAAALAIQVIDCCSEIQWECHEMQRVLTTARPPEDPEEETEHIYRVTQSEDYQESLGLLYAAIQELNGLVVELRQSLNNDSLATALIEANSHPAVLAGIADSHFIGASLHLGLNRLAVIDEICSHSSPYWLEWTEVTRDVEDGPFATDYRLLDCESDKIAAAVLSLEHINEMLCKKHIEKELQRTDWNNPTRIRIIESSSVGFYPSELSKRLGVSNPTINKYAKSADVTTAQKGKRDFRFSKQEAAAICRQFINDSSDGDTVSKCVQLLEEIENKSKDKN